MAQYRTLVDVYVGGQHILAGTTLTMADNWVPSAAFDPLDTPALNAFYAVGPQATPLVRQQWTTQFVAPAVTYWKPTSLPAVPGASGLTSWQLMGLGAGLPAIVT
jgi:hypothetical protein